MGSGNWKYALVSLRNRQTSSFFRPSDAHSNRMAILKELRDADDELQRMHPCFAKGGGAPSPEHAASHVT